MQLPKIDVQPRRLSQLLNDMEGGKLQVPRFQRDFVWPLTKTRALLDSMYKEFPIGSFFLWHAPPGSPPLSRPLEDLDIPAPKPGSEVTYILDGQQRLASLYAVINGVKLGSRDYGRVCIDLETATKCDQTKDEGFDESIFVYRSADNQRYVAVRDLVGQNHLTIFNSVSQEWQHAFNKAYNLFTTTYPLSVVWIQEQKLGDAIEIFQRINQAGKRLSRYDLVCANVWTEDFDFRKRVARLNQRFAQDGFGALHETIYTQAFSLILNDKCTTAAELSLKTDEILQSWDRVVRALQLAVDFVANNLGVKRSNYLPYRGILVVLAYYFYHASSSALSAQERKTLWNWFWRVTLSERYGSTSPSRMAEDAQKLRVLMDGEEAYFDYPSKATPETVGRTKMTSTSSALRNAFICMLALKQPKNLKDGSPVNLTDDFFSNLKKAERHHIFPVGYLKSSGFESLVHRLPNFCFIPSDLNREIGSQEPAKYLAQYQKDNPQFAAAADSHLLPVTPGAAVWNNDFEQFCSERARLIADELNRFIDSKPDEFVEKIAAEPEGLDIGPRVDLLEIRLRDFIGHRLTAVVGLYYWKRTMPGDVIATVKQRIAEHLSRHPYEDSSQFALGRSRLNFCDVSHYEKIILKNWAQFGEFFQRKDEFQRHIAAYRTLRNCVQHNRQPSDIEQQLGDAAMKWLERILDQYEQETLAPSEEDEEELTTTVLPGPSPEVRQVETQKKELSERHLLCREFWTQLLARAKEQTSLHARCSPPADSWLKATAGKRDLAYRYVIRMDDAQVELRIRLSSFAESKRIFDSLYANKDTIERAFGDRLEWLRIEDVRNSRIRYVIPGGGLRDRDHWPEIQDRMIDAMVRLERALKSEIQRLK